ncbi:hypothetical protein LWC35_25435 [Pseudonocardia kujensis]|uniref:hypothetical protein n=1 Tax=Pseudonocardia kujensis TaxID=1128675 RepID=UPI001E5EB09B|nr:hypothetical protein [Pseudonocardia kujensis]MCE0766221.1 hypothetical protein [Pseudonocardia kujensis]
MAVVPGTWRARSARPEDVTAAVLDLVRDMIPFVQTGIKAADELRDRAVLALRQRMRRG